MGIRFHCSECEAKLNVKAFQAGRQGLCPYCGASISIPRESTRAGSRGTPQQQGDMEPPDAPAVEPLANQALEPAPHHSPEPLAEEKPEPTPEQVPEPTPQREPDPTPRQATEPTSSERASAAADATQSANTALDAQPPVVSSGASDPLGEAPHAIWYVRPPSGGQFGPVAGQTMQTWIAEGRITPDSLVWREGWSDWQEASQVFPQLGAGAEGPNPGPIFQETASPSATGGRYRRPDGQRSLGRNIVIISVLVLAVIVLFFVFLWVLRSGF